MKPAFVILCCLLACPLQAQSPVAEAGAQQPPDDASYRAAANYELSLVFQGLAEGGISRSLRFFGAGGRCQAWYEIADVVRAPQDSRIRAGDRLKLDYDCGDARRYVNESGARVGWAYTTSLSGDRASPYAHAWLAAGDIRRYRDHSWEIPNPRNWFAPVAVRH